MDVQLMSRLDPGTLLLDASTIHFLSGHTVYHSLTGRYFADEHTGEALRQVLIRDAKDGTVDPFHKSDLYALTHALSFLEQWMLAERLVVDKRAVESLAHHNPGVPRTEKLQDLSAVFTEVSVPEAVRQQAADNVVAFAETMYDSRNPLHMADLELPLKDGYYNDLRGALGVSGNVPARALFYLELSRILEGPLLLHPQKVSYLQDISRSITDGLTTHYKSLVDQVRSELKLHEVAVTIPPIADEILRTARNERCSLLQAAAAVRETKEITSLRSLMWELNTFASGHQQIRYRRELEAKTEEIARSIESRLSPDTRISRRTVNLAEIPIIGPIFKVLGGGKLSIPDLVLYEKPYIALFSRWANDVAAKTAGQ